MKLECNLSCDDDTKNENYGKCCYQLTDKLQEFLPTDMYLLEYKNMNKKNESADRLKIFYNTFFQAYNVKKDEKIGTQYNSKYFDMFGILPLELLPSSYIPFNYKNYEMNLDRLSKGELFTEDDYKKVYIDLDYSKLNKEKNGEKDIGKKFITDTDIKNYLEYCLKDRLNNPKSIFNAYNIKNMATIAIILWIIVIVNGFNVLFYYYRDIYSYILLFITILLVLIAIIWKMIYILNID
jgi:hypothetical protein